MRQERGQALALLALALVGMLGFSALALDGGMLYTERRRAQNAADNAVLAGALRAAQTGDDVLGETEALAVATLNGYTTGADSTVTADMPPVHTPNPQYNGNPEYIEVTITHTVGTSFIHLVYQGPVQLTVSAVARARPSRIAPIVEGQALVALSETECSALWFTGNGTTTITGGGAFSNSNCADSAGRRGGSGDVSVATGGVNIVGGYQDNGGGGSISPAPTTGVSPLDPIPEVPPPPCDDPGVQNRGSYSLNGGSDTIEPGRYSGIEIRANGLLNMLPGLYCLTGDFSAQSGILNGGGVLIYLQSGSFLTNAGAGNMLRAPTLGSCATTTPELCDFAGLLVYVDPANGSDVRIAGNADTEFTGTVFAPSSECTITGDSGNVGLSSQVMCDTVKIDGNATITLNYDPGDNVQVRRPPEVQLAE